MNYPLTLAFCLLAAVDMQAQTELADPYAGQLNDWKTTAKTQVGWGSTDIRYGRSHVPALQSQPLMLTAWRGERVSAQLVVVAPQAIDRVEVSVSDLKCGRLAIPSEAVHIYKVGYVMADNFRKNDSALVADRLTEQATFSMDARQTRPVWLTVDVSQGVKAGLYTGWVTVSSDGRQHRLRLKVEVVDSVLPMPHEWAFHLDLWQNPYAVARYYDVPLWSKEHFDLMRPVMQRYAEAGGKVITCSIIQHPWNGQTEDPFESMIAKIKTLDGKWMYDYTVFDLWVQFMLDCGVTKQIDCYTLVPWHYKFDYFDLASNSVQYVACKPGEKGYEDFILPFLRDFAAHLKSKGWFSRTCIAMDERPMDQMQAAYDIVKRADPAYRIAGAFNYFPEFTANVHDASVFYSFALLDESVIQARREKGDPVTYYTCCGPSCSPSGVSSGVSCIASCPTDSVRCPWDA